MSNNSTACDYADYIRFVKRSLSVMGEVDSSSISEDNDHDVSFKTETGNFYIICDSDEHFIRVLFNSFYSVSEGSLNPREIIAARVAANHIAMQCKVAKIRMSPRNSLSINFETLVGDREAAFTEVVRRCIGATANVRRDFIKEYEKALRD